MAWQLDMINIAQQLHEVAFKSWFVESLAADVRHTLQFSSGHAQSTV